MNKDSKTLTKIFNMADEMGLYCSMVKEGGEVLHIFVGEQTFFRSGVYDGIHDSDGRRYTYKDLKQHILTYERFK
jgi:hypothetical protein